ncbi:MAG: hypothetical protein ACI87W_000093 [Halieaceae bacterium]|jgi:hypothetical protein
MRPILLTRESDEYIERHIDNMVIYRYRQRITADCEKYELRKFDTSADFFAAIDQAK